MNYRTFKNEVSNLKRYEQSKRELEEKIEDIIYRYGGVKGLSYSDVKITSNKEDRLIEMSEKLEEPQRELDWTIYTINRIKRNIAKLPSDTQEMVKLLFINERSYYYVGAIYNYTANGIYQKVKREIEKI